jgi:hypothetical protein
LVTDRTASTAGAVYTACFPTIAKASRRDIFRGSLASEEDASASEEVALTGSYSVFILTPLRDLKKWTKILALLEQGHHQPEVLA